MASSNILSSKVWHPRPPPLSPWRHFLIGSNQYHFTSCTSDFIISVLVYSKIISGSSSAICCIICDITTFSGIWRSCTVNFKLWDMAWKYPASCKRDSKRKGKNCKRFYENLVTQRGRERKKGRTRICDTMRIQWKRKVGPHPINKDKKSIRTRYTQKIRKDVEYGLYKYSPYYYCIFNMGKHWLLVTR